MSREFKEIAVIGAGLMGCSLALALKKQFSQLKLTMLVKNPEQQEDLAKILDDVQITTNYTALAEAEVIFIATPLSSYADIFVQLNDSNLHPEVIISDLGSVKASLVKLAQDKLNYNFVAAHPIAGSEISGVGAYVEDLYKGKKLLITSDVSRETEIVAKIWQDLGMQVSYISAAEHDRIYAYISHLVQKIAFAAADIFNEEEQKNVEFLRLCKSNPKLWADIFAFNEDALNAAEDVLKKFLSEQLATFAPQETSNNVVLDLESKLNFLALIAICLKKLVNDFGYADYAGSAYKDLLKLTTYFSPDKKLGNFSNLFFV